jgi:hypothetical protein
VGQLRPEESGADHFVTLDCEQYGTKAE